jgi:type III pantothenate kinase
LNLVADIGNSRAKCAIFRDRELVESFTADQLTVPQLEDLKARYPSLDKAIISTVASVSPDLVSYFKSTFPTFIDFTHQTRVPLLNKYQTPATLGLDRLAAAVGAHELFPSRDLLVIDAGTAVTFDLVEGNGTFAGGNISPGLRSRFRALHEFTAKLPLVEASGEVPVIGQTTEEAIVAGVVNGMVFEMDGMIDSMKIRLPEIHTILTGGDAYFFERRLKNRIFVKSEITLIGLNRILEYNVEKQ